jgi:hypothetical protein
MAVAYVSGIGLEAIPVSSADFLVDVVAENEIG